MDTRQGKEKKKKIAPRSPIDIRFILPGLIFFVNPCVSVYDVLPDFIGAILVTVGILHFAEIDDRARSAKKALTILAFVDAGKLLAALAVSTVSGTTWNLVFALVFGVAEAALFSYGMIKLFAAISYRAARLDCAEMLVGFSALNGLTILVAALKNLLPILPELTELTGNYGTVTLGAAGDGEISHFVYIALTALNIIVVTAYGVGWWFYMRRYFKKLSKNGAFLEALEKRYIDEVGSKTEVLTFRALKTARLLFIAGLVFLLPLRLDGIDYLPDPAAGILMLIACLRLYCLYPAPTGRAMIFGGIYTLFAVGEWIGEIVLSFTFAVDHDFGYYSSVQAILLRHPEQMSAYLVIVAVGILKYIALALFLLFLVKVFAPIILDHTGAAFDLGSVQRAQKDAAIKKKLKLLLNIFIFCGFAAALCGIVRRIFRMFSDLLFFEYIELVGVLPLAVVFIYFLAKLEEGIDNKYYIET